MRHAITAYVLSAGTALAHGGHEEAVVQGSAHWLTSGDHVIVLVLAAFVAVVGGLAALRRVRRRLARDKRARP
ncbi:MAG: hypothetical protein NXH97_13090 [Rhodobacteraceae bacterium]|nr:hypothetical protein [Paracoccaceae bacterium]